MTMSKTKILNLSLLIILGLILAFIIIFSLGIYIFNWQDNFTQKVSQILPYPAALVNYKFLNYSNFLEDKETLLHYYNKTLSEDSNQKPDTKEIERMSINRMIKNEFTRQLAKKYKIKVSDLELDQELNKIVSQSESQEKVKDLLKDLYNWTPQQFKRNVLYYYLLRAKLQEVLASDENIEKNREAKKKAEEVLSKVKEGKESFENLAKEYGEDATASQGGYLGFFKKGEMLPEFEQGTASLKPGETSDLIRTKFGYHIIKLLSTRGEGENIEWEAEHILIKTVNLDEYINEKIKEARIYIFLPHIKWNRTNSEAELSCLGINSFSSA